MSSDFDVAVIGGGIIGAGCALESASQGLKTILLEKGDFGSETSAGSFKIIHGGLRYLQHLDFSRLRESAEEQRILRKNASHLVKPLPFLVPCYGYGMKSRLALRTACTVYEFLTKNKNRDIPESLHLPSHRVLSAEDVIRTAPLINREGLTGGVIFYDCQMTNSDRLTLAVLKTAAVQGAVLKNHTKVTEILTEKINDTHQISSLEIEDMLNPGSKSSVKAKFVINAMGPWAEKIGLMFQDKNLQCPVQGPVYSKGIQIVVPQIISSCALAVEGRGSDTDSRLKRGSRSFFLQPWRGYTLVGTTDTIYKGDPEDFSISNSEISEFLKEVYSCYPSNKLDADNVLYSFGGLRAVTETVREAVLNGEFRDGFVNTTRDEFIIDHYKVSGWGGVGKVSNLISIVGVKYTTFRKVSEEVMSVISKKGLKIKKSRTPDILYVGALDHCENILEFENKLSENYRDIISELGDGTLKILIEDYGNEATEILEKTREIYNSFPENDLKYSFIKARVEFSLSNEFAKTTSDIINRRLSEKSRGSSDAKTIDKVCNDMGLN